MLEKDIEKKVKRFCNKNKLECIKLSTQFQAGLPDRMIIGKNIIAFLEIKTEKGVLSNLQKATLNKLKNKYNQIVYVGWGWEDCKSFIENVFLDNDMEFLNTKLNPESNVMTICQLCHKKYKVAHLIYGRCHNCHTK